MKFKWTATNIIALIGFILLFVAFAMGVIVAILFAFPNLSLGGMVAVRERDTQVTYCDEVLDAAFTRGNFIIESRNCNVEIVMPAQGAAGEGTIVVNESATGIAFNSFSRTLIEWTETVVDGVTYFKIKVMEPSGMVFTKKPTTVYLNLKNQTSLHNFILDNTNSTVNFSFGKNTGTEVSQLYIDNLTVRSANTVNLPANQYLEVNNVQIQGNRTKFVCAALVNNAVQVTGNNGTQVFGDINGPVTLQGTGNSFRANHTGAVDFAAATGRLAINTCDALKVATISANVSVNTVAGAVNMTTDSGDLTVDTIKQGGLNFTAGTTADVSVGRAVTGPVIIRNNGVGSISLSGVNGDVDIDSTVKNAGNINVAFQYDADAPHQTKIRGYDGDITVTDIHGATDIRVRDPGPSGAAGRANVVAKFKKITADDNIICTGAYVNSPSGMGKIDVYLLDGWNNFTLYVLWARSAWHYLSGGQENLTVGAERPNVVTGGAHLSSQARLTVATLADFSLR